ncbi:hypothetical protein [Acinetobacter phage Ab69]|nr:hypothetical protein [Acinetobacter phage Ab69]
MADVGNLMTASVVGKKDWHVRSGFKRHIYKK